MLQCGINVTAKLDVPKNWVGQAYLKGNIT